MPHSPKPQTVKVNSARHGPSPNYCHSTFSSQLSGPEGETWHWPCPLTKLSGWGLGLWAVGLQPSFCSDLQVDMQLDGCQSGGRPAFVSLLLSPSSLSGLRISLDGDQPENTSLFLILPSVTLPSYFTLDLWETPPSFSQNSHYDASLSVLLVLWCLRSVLSKSICAKWGIEWII